MSASLDHAVRLARRAAAAGALLFVLAGDAHPPAAGAILVGTHLDLSGPLSAMGNAVRNGLTVAFDEINAEGGIDGRSLHLVALDDGYSAHRALAETRILLFRDHVFAVLCPVGTPPVAATMPLVLNSGVLHLFPFTSADDTYIPRQSLEFAIDLPRPQQIAIGLRTIAAARSQLKVGVLYRTDAVGKAALSGAQAELMANAQHPVAAEGFAPGNSDFTVALAALHNAGAELVVIGGVAQDAITIMQQAVAQQWFPVFLCGDACYVPELPTLGGRAVSGLYVVATTPIPYPDDRDTRLRVWVRRYEQRFGTVASTAAFRAYLDARVFAEALRRAGPDASERRVARALETMTPWKDPEFGGVPILFTPHNHVGLHSGFLAQVRNGRWTTLTGAWPAR